MTELIGVGAELRQAREAQGLTVIDVAQQLKFAPRQIESLEAERFERLPGPTIARGMVRNYARLLQLDPEPLVARMTPQREAASDPDELAARFKRPVPFSDSSRRSTLVYVGFSAGVLLLVGALAYEWQQERAAPQFVAPAQPQRPAEPVRQTAAATQLPQVVAEPPQAPEEKAPEAKAPAAEKPAPEPKIEKPRPQAEQSKPPAEKPQLAAVVPKPAAEAQEKPPAGSVHSIVLRCEEEAWLEVRNDEGRALVSSLNPAGSERAVRARGPLHLVIGNAQHVTLIVDGKPVDLKPHTRVEVARLTIQ